jgi:phosphoribosylformylglycinamidine synthase
MTAPLSLIITAFAPVLDVTKTLTPELQAVENSVLLLIDLGAGKNRLGGSVLGRFITNSAIVSLVDDAKRLKNVVRIELSDASITR